MSFCAASARCTDARGPGPRASKGAYLPAHGDAQPGKFESAVYICDGHAVTHSKCRDPFDLLVSRPPQRRVLHNQLARLMQAAAGVKAAAGAESDVGATK